MLGVEITFQKADRSKKEARKARAKSAVQVVDDDDITFIPQTPGRRLEDHDSSRQGTRKALRSPFYMFTEVHQQIPVASEATVMATVVTASIPPSRSATTVTVSFRATGEEQACQ
jgi:hypothetical protein